MKYSPRPYAAKNFSVEIKKSRRSAASADAQAKAPRDPFLPAPAALSEGTGDDAFAAPAFLKSETRPVRSDLQAHLEEAERLFSPKPAARQAPAPAPDSPAGRVAPRILQSLVEEAATPEPVVEEPVLRRKRGRPKLSAASNETAPKKIVSREAVPQAAVAQDAPHATARGSASAGTPRRPGAKKPARASAEPIAPRAAESDAILFSASDTPLRRAVRRSLDDVAALPRGQQWKRRLHPRAWPR
ncbi:hypothetical protein [Methylocella sp.]|uniref:hypothetical protein n=1 Tax=Methylocella sp. TaxID=1978226 RepID=UPI003783AAB6